MLNIPNIITITRIILALLTYALLLHTGFYLVCFFLTIFVIVGDFFDGLAARKLNQASVFGAWLDIAGDRLVELGFWIVFSCLGWISPWIALIFLTRGIFVDGIRSFAQNEGFTAFGEKTMIQNKINWFIVSSPFSRFAYAACKVFAFSLLILSHIPNIPFQYLIEISAMSFVYMSTVYCVLRGLPVLIEGIRFVK